MLNRSPLLRMKEESDTSNDVLERLASCHLISPHNHLISTKQESPPHASSSPSSTSVSSITSISKVSSSTNGNGASLGGVVSLGAPFDCSLLPAAMYENANLLAAAAVASGFAFHPAINSEQSRLLLMQEMARSALSSTSSTRSKSASSDGSNGDSPISSLSMSVKSKPGAKARSPGSGPVASSTGNREKVFVCQICNRSFGYKHVLQNHERTHTGEKPFECRECHKRFTRDHHLKTHMRLHTGEKPYHCSHCDRQFVQVANLRRHLRVHTGEKPYACELCTSRFSDSNQLKAHMLIHKGEKPFQCKKCDGRFRRRHHLMHHKCPKDEANLGKPRRGRRPKAYDPLQSASPSSFSSSRPGSADDLHHHLPSLLSTSAAVSSTTPNSSNSFYHHGSKHASHHLPHLRSPPAHHLLAPPANLPPTAHSFLEHNSVPKSRRKPRHTNRILPGTQNGHLFDDDDEHGDVQTQPLNLSISPALSVSKQLSSHLGLNAKRLYRPPEVAHDDVLDLSRSRSDAESEPEPIEEDEEDEELTAKEDDMEEMLMMHQNSDYLENGEDSFKRHPLSFSKHYSSNHINNNNNHCSDKSIFSSKLQSLDEKALLESSNGLTALDLATLHLAKLENLKMIKSANTNGVASALKPSHEPKVAAESIVTE